MAINTPQQPQDDSNRQDIQFPLAGEPNAQIAADLIREKVARIYAEEPSVTQELDEASHVSSRSKHQQFMYDLGNSGKDLAIIQTEWHKYYQNLPATEKHQVWQEFYDSQPSAGQGATIPDPQAVAQHKQQAAGSRHKSKASRKQSPKLRDVRSTKEVQEVIRDKVTAGGKLEAKHHLQSLLFGLGMGLIVLIVFLFGFFNEVIVAPFIQPSRATASTPLIVSSNSVAPTATPEVIIPKINVEIPVIYGQTSIAENVIENALENGVVHYPTTAVPGQTGNAAFFGHSSNNIFNKGKYKFAFVLLHTLVPGDTFYLTYNGKVYVYKVITRDIVDPSNVGVLNPVAGQTATATLITCDPPGTSLHRLVVVGQQISPDPAGNTTASTSPSATVSEPAALPGNGPTLWGRFIKTQAGKAVVGAMVVIVFLVGMRLINRRVARPVR